MKHYLISVFLFCIGLSIGGVTIYFFLNTKENHTVKTIEKIQILKDPLFDQGTYLDHDLANIEQMKNLPYVIEPNMTNGRKHITINFPTFFQQTTLQKKEFIKKLEDLGTYQLYLNFSSGDIVDTYRFSSLFGDLHNFNELSIAFHGYPQNYSELFDIIQWDDSVDMKLTLGLNGPSYPYGFHVDAFILHTKEMVIRNNKEKSVEGFWLYVAGLEGFRSFLSNDGESALKTFPTKSLWTSGISIRSDITGPDTRKGKKKIEGFFRDSSIPDMWIDQVGEKKNNIITLHGF